MPNMPVSVVCDSKCSTAIRDSLSSSQSSTSGLNNNGGIHLQILSTAKRALLDKIEYEESPPNFRNTLNDSLKSKYTVLIGEVSPANGPCSSDKNVNGGAVNGSGNNKEAHVIAPKRILFPRENVQIGWKTGRKWQVGAGMMNVGNTCYLNSTLQALFHVPAFANWLYSDDEHRKRCEESRGGAQGDCIICAMAKTLKDSQENQQSIKPWSVYSKLRLVCKHLVPGHQEDAHEFLRYLVEAMEKAFLCRFKNSKEFDQYTKETTPLNQILGGYLKSSVRCLDCGHVSVTFQHFEDLLLDIRKANSIDEALETHFARERLEDMGYKCEACKKKVSATKQFSLERAPISLCIQLKRFSMMGGKINKHVAFRQKLDLSAYSSKKSTEPLIYRLVALVTHLGASQHCGHYTAIGIAHTGGYYHFDDSCVRPISLQNVLQTNAYIMFYELDEGSSSMNKSSNGIANSTVTSKTITSTSTLASPIKIFSETSKSANNNENHDTKLVVNGGGRLLNGNNNSFGSKADLSSNTKILGTKLVNAANSSTPAATTTTTTSTSNGNNTPTNTFKLNNGPLTPSPSSSSGSSNSTPNGHQNNNAHNGKYTPEKLHDENKVLNISQHTNGPYINVNKKLPKLMNGDQQHEHKNKSETSNSPSPNKSSLPSMPKLDVSTAISPPASTNPFQINSLHLLKSSSIQTTVTHTTINGIKTNGYIKNVVITNGTSTAPPHRSLVPYDDDSDTNNQSDDSCSAADKSQSNSMFDDDDDEASKSPPMIDNPSGSWKVTPATTFLTVSYNSQNGQNKRFNNSDDTGSNKVTTINDTAAANSTVSKLIKNSHRGYGGTVTTWNGQVSSMDKEVISEKQEEIRRKRELDADSDMDRGRQKKIKHNNHNNHGRGDNVGYNPFQETQNQSNNHNRWNNNHRFTNSYNNNFGRPNSYFNKHNSYRGGHGGRQRHNGYNRNDQFH